MCPSPTATVHTRSPHLSCSSCCCCCVETSITVPKENVPATLVSQLHHMTNRTNQATRHGLTPSRQPIPDSAGFRTKSRIIKGKRTLSKGALSQKSKVKSPKSRRVKGRNGKKSTVKKSKETKVKRLKVETAKSQQ